MHPIIALLSYALSILSILLLVWIIISWLISFQVLNTSNRLVYSVYDGLSRLFEPMLRHIRKYLPSTGTIDFAPIVLYLLIWFAQYCLGYYF